MVDPAFLIVTASTATLAVALSAAAALKGWQGWLDIRRLEIGGPERKRPTGRLEIADLRERVRRLERIASGTQP